MHSGVRHHVRRARPRSCRYPPAITLSHANGDMTVDLNRRAISGHASPIDSSTAPPLPKQQEGAPSPSESDHVVSTRGSTEAFWPRSPVSPVFGDLESHPISFPNSQTAVAFTRNHHHHPRTGHTDVPQHWTRLDIKRGLRRPVYCAASDTVADALAPPPTKEKHFAASLRLRAR